MKVVPEGQASNAPHQPILALPASGPASATLYATPSNLIPVSYAWSQVLPATQSYHAANATVSFSAANTSSPQVTVSFPIQGIYQLQVVATAGNGATTSEYIWINVWDRFSGLNPLKQIGLNPGLNPPSAVRQLSPDPGPYQHPRLLFTKADWSDLNSMSTASTEVSGAIARLQSALNNNFDKTSAPAGSLRTYASALTAWADGGFVDAAYSASVEPVRVFSERKQLGADPRNNLPDALIVSAYLVWVRNNPALAQNTVPSGDQSRFQYLAKIAAASARAELTHVRLGVGTSLIGAPDMAVAYDLLYDWMTPAQRSDLRDYLYAIGYGYFNNGGGGLNRGSQPTNYIANGDFPNLVDPWILAALVIEGEEADVNPSVVAANTPLVPPATGPSAWPNASPASVWNLSRMMRWYSEFFVTPWGSPLNHHAYYEASSGMSGPAMLALARRGQNGFITTNVYQASFHALNNFNPEVPNGPLLLWDHHDGMGFGNGIGGYAGRYLARYMYPDDALMDMVYPVYRAEVSVDFYTAMWHVDRPALSMAQVAAAKALPLTRFDPFRGYAVTRNSWAQQDLSLYFECRPDVQGHMHAEANNFSLYALGRAWSTPPGYHVNINDASAGVLIQDPSLAADPATQGYYGESPSAATITPTRSQFPTPPGKFLEATEDPGSQWTLFAGDATATYQYAFEGSNSLDTGKRTSSFYYGDVLTHMYPNYDPVADTANLKVGNLSYNPAQYAYRTVFTVRGTSPYVLVLDDITVDGVTPRNYRWNMPAFGRNAVTSLKMQSGATTTDAILYHQTDAASGPRLLVRDISEQSASGQPAIKLDTRLNGDGQTQLSYGYDNNSQLYSSIQSNRLLITRQNVVSPKFKVLLFPHESGANLPLTSWNADKTVASIELRNGFTDQITIDPSAPDKRTRIRALVRTLAGRTAPTLDLPTNLVIYASPGTPAFNGQPGAVATFNITATSDTGATLTPAVSSPSGTDFPIGANPVLVTVIDSAGQVTSRQFIVTVVPAAPVVSVTSVSNLPGGSFGLTLGWKPFDGATAYSVKRATTPGGPYSVISDRQTGTSFTDGNLDNTNYFYVVTAWVNDLEGPLSAEIPLAGDATPFSGQTIGATAPGNGFYRQGGSYLLTSTGGSMGNFNDQFPFISIPWQGDGTFTTRLVSITGEGGPISQFDSFGIVMRQSTASNDLMAASCFNTYVNPVTAVWRSTTGSVASTSGPFHQTTLALPIWLRLVRSGSSVFAFYSSNGATWIQTATPTTVNFTGPTLVGLGGDGQNSTRTSVQFDNLVFLGTPRGAVQPGSISLTWDSSPSLVYSLQRATSVNGPFTTLATGLTSPSFTDTDFTTGSTYYYTVSTCGALGGSTLSGVATVYYPTPSLAPTGLILTPSVGQIALAWDAAPAGTNSTFSVQRATSANGPYITVATGLTSSSYVDTGAGFANGTAYFYRIVADNGLGAATSTTATASSLSGTFTKANNTTALDSGTSWTPTAIPCLADTALWTGTYTTGAVSIGSGLSVKQLQLSSPSQAITLNADSGNLTLGTGGIDLSTSTQNLTVNAPVLLATDQIWTIASGRTLSVSGGIDQSGGARVLTLAGNGAVLFSGNNTFAGGLTMSPLVSGVGVIARLSGGAFPAPISADGRLEILGPISSLGQLSGSGATGIVVNSSTTSQNLTFAGGSSFSKFQVGADSARAVLRRSGSGTVSFSLFGYNTATPNAQHTFDGGAWIFGQIGQNNTGMQTSGVFTLTNGADVTVSTQAGFTHGTWRAVNGTLRFNGNIYPGNGNTIYASLVFLVDNSDGGPGLLTSTGGLTLADGGSATNANSLTIGVGGSVTLGGGITLGSTTAHTSETDTVNLGGGKLLANGTLAAAAITTGQTRTFNWTAGQLTAATITPSSGYATPASGGISTTALVQTGGTLAPGDVGTAGRTQINGEYSLSSGGTLAMDLGGTTQANGFQSGQYDYLTVSGTTTLAGNLTVSLLTGFTPSNATTFTIVNSTGALSGAFGNVAFNQRIVTASGEGTFLVTQSGNTVRLSAYTANTLLQTWRYQNFGTIANTGTAADTADPDGDGLINLIEYAYGLNPLINSISAITTSSNSITHRGPATFSLTNANNEVSYHAVFGRRKDYLAAGLSYTVQFSADLSSWQNNIVTPTVIASDADIEAVSVPFPLLLNSGAKPQFFRLNIATP